ncbi:MAG: SPFH domain-containing protein [Alphaproteobacteria bacterium]|jgi:regulator of protease activity HflC (stomatin/prohibitin superfamily)
MQSIKDTTALSINGFLVLFLTVLLIALFYLYAPFSNGTKFVSFIPFILASLVIFSGFTIIQPNEAVVITFFGKYIGTIKESGFLFTVPFSSKDKIPLKLINFVTEHLKVNDKNGNPIEIGAVVVWRVEDAAKASLNIDDYKTFVANQSDIAIRTLAAHYPYDSEKEASLRGNIDEIAAKLNSVLQDKLSLAGITVEETKLSHLAYASEIAVAMLKRQQAVAIFEARKYMVENTLAIIDDVIKHLEKKDNIKISDDKKMQLINNLLVVMTSDSETNPVLNVGS